MVLTCSLFSCLCHPCTGPFAKREIQSTMSSRANLMLLILPRHSIFYSSYRIHSGSGLEGIKKVEGKGEEERIRYEIEVILQHRSNVESNDKR